MKLNTLLIPPLIGVIAPAFCAVRIDLAIIRSNNISISDPIDLSVDGKTHKIYQDARTYIEVELLEEKTEVKMRFIVATTNESNAFMVRGAPHLNISLEHGLGMTSLQCNGKDEMFNLLVAAVKV